MSTWSSSCRSSYREPWLIGSLRLPSPLGEEGGVLLEPVPLLLVGVAGEELDQALLGIVVERVFGLSVDL